MIQKWKINEIKSHKNGLRKTVYGGSSKYKGEWSGDKKNGYGVIFYKNGKYEGNWENN